MINQKSVDNIIKTIIQNMDHESQNKIFNALKESDITQTIDRGMDKNISLFFLIWELIPEEIKTELIKLIKTSIEKLIRQLRD